jgi:hypothetical protein
MFGLYQALLIDAPQFLDGRLALTCGTAIMTRLQVHQLFRLAATEILCAALTGVLQHTPFGIVADPRVQRIIAA